MASEPDDYQTISDNCPGYMILISEGIICTRCSGEKRHKPVDCPKPTAAADLASETVPEADPTASDNADSEMESLSDTDSVSSESTSRSEGSETRVADAHQSDQGGNHPQNTHLTRRGFTRPNGSHTRTEPNRTRRSLPNHQAAGNVPMDGPSRVHENSIEADGQAAKTSSAGSGTTSSTELPSTKPHSSIKRGNHKTQHGSHSHRSPTQRVKNDKATGDRSPSKSLADTTGKFDYSNTTCPSSFGFGRLPSEAMG